MQYWQPPSTECPWCSDHTQSDQQLFEPFLVFPSSTLLALIFCLDRPLSSTVAPKEPDTEEVIAAVVLQFATVDSGEFEDNGDDGNDGEEEDVPDVSSVRHAHGHGLQDVAMLQRWKTWSWTQSRRN